MPGHYNITIRQGDGVRGMNLKPRTYVIPIFLIIFFIVGWLVRHGSPCGGACAR